VLSQSQSRPPDNAVSEVQQNGRRSLKDIGTLILRGLAVALFSGAIGAAAAILVHPPTIGGQLFVPTAGSPAAMTT
jgi:hypothetical protein